MNYDLFVTCFVIEYNLSSFEKRKQSKTVPCPVGPLGGLLGLVVPPVWGGNAPPGVEEGYPDEEGYPPWSYEYPLGEGYPEGCL